MAAAKSDVKHGSLLSKSVCGPPAAPVPRPLISDEEYVYLSKLRSAKCSNVAPPASSTSLVSKSDDKKGGISTGSVGKQSASSGSKNLSAAAVIAAAAGGAGRSEILKALGKTQDEVSDMLRLEVIRSMEPETPMEGKRAWTTVALSQFSTVAESRYMLNDSIDNGEGISQRAGENIWCSALQVRLRLFRTVLAPSANINYQPLFCVCIYREKLPATPGTPTYSTHATGQNPPTENKTIYTRLGDTSVASNFLSFRNPINEPFVHVYRREYLRLNDYAAPMDGIAPYAVDNSPAVPTTKEYVWDIPLNFISQFTSTASSTPYTNNLYFSISVDRDVTNAQNGYFFDLASLVVFHDNTTQV